MLVDKTLAFRKPFGEHCLLHPMLYLQIFSASLQEHELYIIRINTTSSNRQG